MNPFSFAALLADRKLWLLGLSTVLAIVLGFFAIPDEAAIRFVSNAGFWIVLAGFVIILHALWQTLRNDWSSLRLTTIDWTSVAVIGLGIRMPVLSFV